MALFIPPNCRASDADNASLSGAVWKFYLTGTLTPATVYTSAALSTPHGSSVTADAGGRFANIFLDPLVTYRAILETAGGSQLFDVDPYPAAESAFTQAGSGAVARTVASKLQDAVSVLDFIPVSMHAAILAGTSTDDHGSYIQLAFNVGKSVHFPGGVGGASARYNTGQEIDCAISSILGDGPENCAIVALSAIRSVFKVRGRVWVQGLLIDGNAASGKLANYGLYCENSNGAIITNNEITGCKLDGIHFPASGNNTNTSIHSNHIYSNGHEYTTGTAATTASGSVATITGAIDLTTLPIRVGYDLIKIGSNPARTITGVTASTITVSSNDPFNTTVSGSAYKILIGHGVLNVRHSDNGLMKLVGNTLRANKCSGYREVGLYGGQITGNTMESNEYGWIWGSYNVGGGTPGGPISPRERDSYTEGGAAAGLIEWCEKGSLAPGPTQDGLDGIRIPTYATISSLRIDYAGESHGSVVASYTNQTSITLVYGQTVNVTMSSGGGNMTINLPAITSGSNSAQIFAGLDQSIIVDLLAIGGKTATFKTTDGSTINGIAGTTGITLYGDYRRATMRLTAVGEWTLVASAVTTGLNELTGSKTFDPPSVAAAGVTTTTVTVTGAVLGDYANASFSLALGGLMLRADVSAADTVTCTFFNPTGGAIDLGSGTLRARVLKV